MAQYKRNNISELFQTVTAGNHAQIYLIFGERYLCRQTADELIKRLLPDPAKHAGNLRNIDGDNENPIATLAAIRTYNLFPGRHVVKVQDSRLFHSKVVADKIWDKALAAYESKNYKKAEGFLKQLLAIANMSGADLADLSNAKWKSVLGFTKPDGDFAWFKDVLGESGLDSGAPAVRKTEMADQFQEAFTEGIPADNILVLIADTVDKRKRFYKYINKHGVIIDLAVDAGFSKAAGKDQQNILTELVHKKLAEFGKKIAPAALEMLLERVGFHPTAVVMETEKLALFVGTAERISVADLNQVVGRTREEALFELNEAFTSRNLAKTLQISRHLRAGGLHPLVIISGLRNHIRKMLVVRSILNGDDPAYGHGLSFAAFQKSFLAQLKGKRESLPAALSGHPYAAYMLCQKVENFSAAYLIAVLRALLGAEYRLKGSAVAPDIILESLFMKMIPVRRRA